MSTSPRWYTATKRADGSRWLVKREGDVVTVMAHRGLTIATMGREAARKDYELGEVCKGQALADEQYRLACALERVRPQGGRYALA